MNKEILEKYYAGRATVEEAKQVQDWLSAPEIEAPLSLSPRDEKIGVEIWKDIRTGIARKQQKKRIHLGYKIAASITIALLVTSALFHGQSNNERKDSGRANLDVRMASYSHSSYQLTDNALLRFCGDMEISNKGSKDYMVTLKTNCPDDRSMQTSFLSKVDHEYIAVVYQHTKKEILVIDKEELRRESQPLPRRLINKLTKEFSI